MGREMDGMYPFIEKKEIRVLVVCADGVEGVVRAVGEPGEVFWVEAAAGVDRGRGEEESEGEDGDG